MSDPSFDADLHRFRGWVLVVLGPVACVAILHHVISHDLITELSVPRRPLSEMDAYGSREGAAAFLFLLGACFLFGLSVTGVGVSLIRTGQRSLGAMIPVVVSVALMVFVGFWFMRVSNRDRELHDRQFPPAKYIPWTGPPVSR